MLRWRGACLALIALTGCGAPQPDVSAFTILNLLYHSEGLSENLIPAFGSLYEDVHLETPQAADAEGEATVFAASLGRDDQTFAKVSCASGLMSPLRPEAFAVPEEIVESLNADTFPASGAGFVCAFIYKDAPRRLSAFEAQAAVWTDTAFGTLIQSERDAGFLAHAVASEPDGSWLVIDTTRGWFSGNARIILGRILP